MSSGTIFYDFGRSTLSSLTVYKPPGKNGQKLTCWLLKICSKDQTFFSPRFVYFVGLGARPKRAIPVRWSTGSQVVPLHELLDHRIPFPLFLVYGAFEKIVQKLGGNVTKDFPHITLQNWPIFPAAPYTLAGGK